MPQNIHPHRFRRHFAAITRGILCILWAMLLLVVLFIDGGRLTLMEGQTNGAVNSFGLWMLCVLSGLVIGLLYLAGLVVRFVRCGGVEGMTWCAATIALAIILFTFPGPQRSTAYVTGFRQWAVQLKPQQIRTWGSSLGLSAAPPTLPPDWWRLSDLDQPFGVSAPVGATRSLFSGPLPDEVRLFPASGRVIFGWGFTGSFSRLVVILGDGETRPPPEFDPLRVTWHQLSNDAWLGQQETH